MERDNPTSHRYYSQRLRLHYLDWGNADAPPMLMIHGIHDHCHTWDWLARRWRHAFHIVAPDLRGHGDSQWTLGSSYAYLEYVQDIAQLVRQAELAPLTLVGHSMGGTIAAMYAGVYPEAVARLVLVEGIGLHPSWLPDAPHERLKTWIDANYALAGRVPKRYPSVEAAYQRMQATNPHLRPDQASHLTAHGSNQNEDGTYSWKFDNYTRAPRPYDVPQEDMIALWQRITCPVLIVNSTDGYAHRIGHNGTDAHFQDVTMVTVDDAGHWTHHDQLQAVVDAAAPFLGVC